MGINFAVNDSADWFIEWSGRIGYEPGEFVFFALERQYFDDLEVVGHTHQHIVSVVDGTVIAEIVFELAMDELGGTGQEIGFVWIFEEGERFFPPLTLGGDFFSVSVKRGFVVGVEFVFGRVDYSSGHSLEVAC